MDSQQWTYACGNHGRPWDKADIRNVQKAFNGLDYAQYTSELIYWAYQLDRRPMAVLMRATSASPHSQAITQAQLLEQLYERERGAEETLREFLLRTYPDLCRPGKNTGPYIEVHTKGKSKMENNIAAMLMPRAKTVDVRFFGSDGAPSGSTYRYISEQPLEQDDIVVVQTGSNNRMVTAVVAEVHDDLLIEPNEDIKYKWVVAKVDIKPFEALQERIKEIERQVSGAYKRNLRRGFADAVLASLPDNERNDLQKLIGG